MKIIVIILCFKKINLLILDSQIYPRNFWSFQVAEQQD